MAEKLCLSRACTRLVKHPRLLCKEHWYRLPDLVRAQILSRMMARDFDSARIVLYDWYSRENDGEGFTNA